MDGLVERLATVNRTDLFAEASDEFKLLKSKVFKMSRADLVKARTASSEVWTFLANFVVKKRILRSQVASVARVLAADEGWKRNLEEDVDFKVLDLLEFAFADEAACAKACAKLERTDHHLAESKEPFQLNSEWQELEKRVCEKDLQSANDEFVALRSSVLASTAQDLDRQSERAVLVFEFLIGFASLKTKRLFHNQIIEVVGILMQAPSWRQAFVDHSGLHAGAAGLHVDVRAAFAIPETDVDIDADSKAAFAIPQTDVDIDTDLRETLAIQETDADIDADEKEAFAILETDVDIYDIQRKSHIHSHDPLCCQPSMGTDPLSSEPDITDVGSWSPSVQGLAAEPTASQATPFAPTRRCSNKKVDNAAADLRHFVESEDGQDLIWRVFECYEFIVKMAAYCRNRSRFLHGTTRILAGATSAGGATAVIVGAAMMAASAGTAAPVAGPVLLAGFTAGALGAGATVISSLTMLGWDAADARRVGKRIEELSARIEHWDHYMNAMLQAIAQGTEGETADFPHIANDIATALAEYGASASSMYSVAAATFRASQATSNTFSAAAPAALGGVVQATTVAATTLTISFSAASVVCGLVESICGGMQMWSGYCEAADSLDSHADKFCAILRLMKEAARGTPVQTKLRGKLPWLVLIQVNNCKLPKPEYRVLDKTMPRLASNARVYFEFQMRIRQRKTEELVKVTPDVKCAIGQAVLMRVFPKDKLKVKIQARDRRGIQSYLRGDPAMGSRLKLQLRRSEDHRVLKLPGGNTKINVSYWLVRGDRWIRPARDGRHLPMDTQLSSGV